jgi:uncharacterized membrane protein
MIPIVLVKAKVSNNKVLSASLIAHAVVSIIIVIIALVVYFREDNNTNNAKHASLLKTLLMIGACVFAVETGVNIWKLYKAYPNSLVEMGQAGASHIAGQYMPDAA